MARGLADERPHFLSTLPAGPADHRLAAAVVAVSAAIFLIAVPFAKVPLAPVWAFIPIYESATVVNDLVTAVLLFGQFGFLRSRALLVLASGYLFTAFIAVAHALTFPGLFAPSGLLGAGTQSTAWLYMFWHAVFPLCVIGYALLKRRQPEALPAARVRVATFAGAAAALVAVVGLAFLATAGEQSLPALMQGSRYMPAQAIVLGTVWLLSFAALAVLWWQRPYSVLDLWLMIVMCAWVFDIGLSGVFNAARFDLGFYAGRIYGLLASGFVLVVLLLQNSILFGRLVDIESKHARRLEILSGIDRAIAARETAAAIAGAAIEPLREVLGLPRAIVNIFDLEAGEVEWLAAAGRHRTHVGPGVRYSIELMGDVDALKRGEPQIIDTRALPSGPETDALLASGVYYYTVMPMIAAGELIGALSFGGEHPTFPPEQMIIAREAATQLAIAVAQARLYERIKRQAEDLEARVLERTAELEGAIKELDAFSYSVSHDLRAPVRAIDGYARMLEEDYGPKLDEEGNRMLGVVRRSSAQMGRLIDDLLAFSRLGREPIRTRSVWLDDLVKQVIAETRSETDGRTVDFVVGELGIAQADPSLLKQALANLVSNAIKFTRHKQTALVEVGRRNKINASDVNTYYVKDNGAGFDMKYYNKLFGVFQRLHSSSEYPGTGVGLAIVQRVIHRHGGRVWADSTLGEGATFYFTLERDSHGAPEQDRAETGP